jgi:hypothetical protein
MDKVKYFTSHFSVPKIPRFLFVPSGDRGLTAQEIQILFAIEYSFVYHSLVLQ